MTISGRETGKSLGIPKKFQYSGQTAICLHFSQIFNFVEG